MKVGVLGAGQLGRMLALAGIPWGFEFLFVDPAENAPAALVGRQLVLDYDDPRALAELEGLDVVTYEFENVPDRVASQLASKVPVLPAPAALRVAQDRWLEKTTFRQLGIDTADFVRVDSLDDLRKAVARLGHPAVLKTRRHGYDGKGQVVVHHDTDLGDAWRTLGGVPCIAEAFVEFDRELSVLAVRSRTGELALYPLVANEHRSGILRVTTAPAEGVSVECQRQAEGFATRLLEHLGYVGVLALELFETAGQVVANEFAPRVHNSGHFSIEGAATSQFENHLRAIAGWPLGSPRITRPCAMVNLIGLEVDPIAVAAIPEAHLHTYGKAVRPGRKVGHVTVLADDRASLDDRLRGLRELVDSP